MPRRVYPVRTSSHMIGKKVDLERPDKILRIDMIGRDTAISVLKTSEIFSIVKERRSLVE